MKMDKILSEKNNLHLILGGQRSGKTAFAEKIAAQWLEDKNHHAIYVATAQAYDAEIEKRILLHQKIRSEKYPKLQSITAQNDLSATFSNQADAQTLILVDCLGMWLTNWIAPAVSEYQEHHRCTLLKNWRFQRDQTLTTIMQYPGPVILVSNEVGLGVVPLGQLTRDFVDELGHLNQMLAARAGRVSAVMAGLEWRLKG